MGFLGRLIIFQIVAVFTVNSPLSVAEIYKCEVDGKLVMQDTPCPDGVAQSTVDVVIPSLMMRASLVIGKIS